MSEDEFSSVEPYAESILDGMTLNRIKSGDSEKGDPSAVTRAMVVLVDYVPQIREAFKSHASGSEVSSFSNGVDSFSFASGTSTGAWRNEAMAAALAEVTLLLPIELISADVSYNHAS